MFIFVVYVMIFILMILLIILDAVMIAVGSITFALLLRKCPYKGRSEVGIASTCGCPLSHLIGEARPSTATGAHAEGPPIPPSASRSNSASEHCRASRILETSGASNLGQTRGP